MPAFLSSTLVFLVQRYRTRPINIATKESIIKWDSKGTGVISALDPTSNKMLKMLDPMMFPIAISALSFLAMQF